MWMAIANRNNKLHKWTAGKNLGRYLGKVSCKWGGEYERSGREIEAGCQLCGRGDVCLSRKLEKMQILCSGHGDSLCQYKNNLDSNTLMTE
jgi:hypothetical protein